MGREPLGPRDQHHVAQLPLGGARLHLAHQTLGVVVGAELIAAHLLHARSVGEGVGGVVGQRVVVGVVVGVLLGVQVVVGVLVRVAVAVLEAGIGVVDQVPAHRRADTRG